MKKIIIPMDFTEVANNAFRYAYHSFPNAELYIVHANAGIVSTRQPIYLQPGKSKDMVLSAELEKQILYELKVAELPQNMSIHILQGEVIPSIQKFVAENQIDVMVAGTRDKYDLFDRWIGTFSLGLVKTLDIPTYLIPRYATYKPYQNVLAASDYHVKNTNFLQQIQAWNRPYQAFIKFLHISTNYSDTFEQEKDSIVQSLFEDQAPSFSFEIDAIYNKDITESLLANAYTMGADLLVVMPENRSFLHTLLFKSISKELILKSSIPILFLQNRLVAEDLNNQEDAGIFSLEEGA